MSVHYDTAYYRSELWAAFRAFVRARCHGICEQCGTQPMQAVHHLTYARFGGKERVQDLLGVCHPCHAGLHEQAWRAQRLMECVKRRVV